MAITAKDVAKLRNQTGAGMMDCKKALTEANGDFEAAVDLLRKQGQKVAAKRSDRDAKEGAVLAKSNGSNGAALVLNCETDFVAINESFLSFAQSILDTALENKAKTIDEVKALQLNGHTIEDNITSQIGTIGEKLQISAYEFVSDESVAAYIHPGNKLATLVSLNKAGNDAAGKDVAMQVAAMAPVALNRDLVSQETIDRELEVGKELARQEGKPEAMLEKIAQGRLNKFFKESTLVDQAFVKDSKKSVSQYLNDTDKGLAVTGFKRLSL